MKAPYEFEDAKDWWASWDFLQNEIWQCIEHGMYDRARDYNHELLQNSYTTVEGISYMDKHGMMSASVAYSHALRALGRQSLRKALK